MISPLRRVCSTTRSIASPYALQVWLRGAQQAQGGACIVGGCRERLVQLVRERGRHLPHQPHARHPQQPILQFVQPTLRLLTFGQIADKAGEQPRAGLACLADRQFHRERAAILAPTHHDTPDADDAPLACGTIASEIAVVLVAVGLRHQQLYVLPVHFVGRISE